MFLGHISEYRMRLVSYRARCGDAFHLKYVGNSGKIRNIFLDMGHAKTYDVVLKNVVTNLVNASEKIDALFLSHIHNDHIGGAVEFIKDAKNDIKLKNAAEHWIYNAPRRYEIDKEENEKGGLLCSVAFGDIVYEYIKTYFPLDVMDYVAGDSFDIDGMKVSLLSPDIDKLSQLTAKYSNNRPLCKSESDEISTEAGGVTDDYSIPLKSFETDSFEEDSSIENASSIAAIFEFDGKRILWLADAIPSVIIQSLSNMGFSESNKMHCDSVLLSHHGSALNNSSKLFRMISAEKFFFSADGVNKYCLPNKSVVARIVASVANFPVDLYFNYCDGRLPRMFLEENSIEIGEMLKVHYLGNCEAVEI